MSKTGASTKRRAVNSTIAQTGDWVTVLSDLQYTPLDAVFDEAKERAVVGTPTMLLQTFVEGTSLDIREGDVLVIDSQDYPIQACAPYVWRDKNYYHLTVEKIRT